MTAARPFSGYGEFEKAEEKLCTCGAGHGSGFPHTEWCEWTNSESKMIRDGNLLYDPDDPCATLRFLDW